MDLSAREHQSLQEFLLDSRKLFLTLRTTQRLSFQKDVIANKPLLLYHHLLSAAQDQEVDQDLAAEVAQAVEVVQAVEVDQAAVEVDQAVEVAQAQVLDLDQAQAQEK